MGVIKHASASAACCWLGCWPTEDPTIDARNRKSMQLWPFTGHAWILRAQAAPAHCLQIAPRQRCTPDHTKTVHSCQQHCNRVHLTQPSTHVKCPHTACVAPRATACDASNSTGGTLCLLPAFCRRTCYTLSCFAHVFTRQSMSRLQMSTIVHPLIQAGIHAACTHGGQGCAATTAAVAAVDAAYAQQLQRHDTSGWRVSVIIPVRPGGRNCSQGWGVGALGVGISGAGGFSGRTRITPRAVERVAARVGHGGEEGGRKIGQPQVAAAAAAASYTHSSIGVLVSIPTLPRSCSPQPPGTASRSRPTGYSPPRSTISPPIGVPLHSHMPTRMNGYALHRCCLVRRTGRGQPTTQG